MARSIWTGASAARSQDLGGQQIRREARLAGLRDGDVQIQPCPSWRVLDSTGDVPDPEPLLADHANSDTHGDSRRNGRRHKARLKIRCSSIFLNGLFLWNCIGSRSVN